MKINIAKVFNTIEESATLAINQNIKSLRSEGKTIYHLGFGESPFPVPEAVKTGLRRGETVKAYQPTQGISELREQVSKFYAHWFKLNYPAEDIFIGPGSKELIFDLMHLIDGDLILPVPSWVSYIPQARISGKSAIKVSTQLKNNYCMTVEELDCAYNQGLKDGLNPQLMLINTPGNPCGNSYPEELVKEIANYAREKNIYLISDEIYANIIFKGYNHTSFAKYYPEGTFVTGGISKDRSLGGYRLGVCLIPSGQVEFKKAFNTLISETFSCVSSPIQYAAIAAYSLDYEMTDFIKICTSIHDMALNYFWHELNQSEFIDCPPAMGAFYLYPKYRLSKLKTASEISKILLEKYNVASLPANCFGQSDNELNTRLAITDYDGSKALDFYVTNPRTNINEFIKDCCPHLEKAAAQIKKFAEDYA